MRETENAMPGEHNGKVGRFGESAGDDEIVVEVHEEASALG